MRRNKNNLYISSKNYYPKYMPKSKNKPHTHALKLSLAIFSLLIFSLGATVFFTVKSQFCANSISCINDLSGKASSDKTGVYLGQTIPVPKIADEPITSPKHVLGVTTGAKRMYVSLNSQRLYAYQGNSLVYNFAISSGKWHPTPTGEFHIWTWLRYTRMTGGDSSLGTYYDLPNVPFTMYFYNKSIPKTAGYSLHGAYWHNNFGHPMSHGCINMKEEDVARIYEWTYQDTAVPIIIYGTTPSA
jgi:L,D-transpeptidase-like protein